MNLTLRRTSYTDHGIFGLIIDANGDLLCYTLEHAYDKLPKLPQGIYECVRGEHKLKGMLVPFETFEVTKVPGHTGILVHCGNYDHDSSGCILVGTAIEKNMITESRKAFAKFLALQQDVSSFILTVK